MRRTFELHNQFFVIVWSTAAEWRAACRVKRISPREAAAPNCPPPPRALMHVSRTCPLAGCFGGQKTPMGVVVVVGVGSLSDSEQPACCFLLRFDSRNCSNKAVAAQPAVAFTSTWSPQTGCCWPGNDRLSPRWLNSPWARRTSRQKKGECARLCLYGCLFLAPQIKFLFKFGCRRFWSLKYLFLDSRSSSGLYFRVTTWQPRNV